MLGNVPDGAKDMLQKLQQMGLKLGVLSNTFIHKSSLERHLQANGLLDYLPVRLYTYEYPWRKPDERIFREGAQKIGVDCDKDYLCRRPNRQRCDWCPKSRDAAGSGQSLYQ